MRLGVLGGTFDPIHLGHLLVADQTRDALGLDRVLLIPAGRPPHKPEGAVAPYSDRLRMIDLAIEGLDGLESSDLEKDAAHPSYTAGTLRRIRAEVGGSTELWLLLGADSLADLSTWREPREILRLASLAVYPREGGRENAESAAGPWPHEPMPVWVDGPRLSVSSSEIRDRVRRERSIRFLVPEAVRGYILDRGLYRTGSMSPSPLSNSTGPGIANGAPDSKGRSIPHGDPVGPATTDPTGPESAPEAGPAS